MTRTRRTKAQIAAFEARILALMANEEDRPQSLRNVYYRLVAEGTIEKTDRAYQGLIDRATKMRRRDAGEPGHLPYGWISDASRLGYHVDTYRDHKDFLRSTAAFYRQDIWRSIPSHVEVWCESRSLAGVLRGVCRELAVSLYPTGGFASLTLVHSAAQEMAHTGKDHVVVFYIGDYDPAGFHIPESLERDLRGHLDNEGMELEFRRLAINEAQIGHYGLPGKPRKEGEKRRQDIEETVEAEALPAIVTRQLVRDAVQAYLPADALVVARVAEASEREIIHRIAA